MTATSSASASARNHIDWSLTRRLPLLSLLNPRALTRWVLVSGVIGLALAAVGLLMGLEGWVATVIALAALLPIGLVKWRQDRVLYGPTAMGLSILLTAQGIHTIEHIVQWAQYHVLLWSARQATGLVSAANAEWVHFVWNWAVLVVVLILLKGGLRNVWMGVLIAVAVFHTIEHTYTFVRYLQILHELSALGVTNVTAQGLPGIIGRDGWLARSPLTQGTFMCSLPGLTTAIRLDVHFWWNVIEMSLLMAAGHVFLRARGCA